MSGEFGGWIPDDPDAWKLPDDPLDWLPPDPYEDMFGPWGPGGPFGVNPNDPFGDPFGPDGVPKVPEGWGPDGPVWEPFEPPASGPVPPVEPPPPPPPIEPPPVPPSLPPEPPPPTGPGTAAIVSTDSAAGVIGLALLPAIAMFGALFGTAVKWYGWPSFHWPWGKSACDESLEQIGAAVQELQADANAFQQKPSRAGAREDLSQAGFVIALCGAFLRDCPDHSGVPLVRAALSGAEQVRDGSLDWLAVH